MSRQILLDTETTGIETKEGHRIIEIGCVEMIDRKMTGNDYQQYIQPNRVIDAGALGIHGITPEFLADKPLFEAIAPDFIRYVSGAELIIHNAPFDIGFLNYEMSLLSQRTGHQTKIDDICAVIDTLVLARGLHPGQRNSLNALCKRYDIKNEGRELHGALLDSQILGDVYLAMTGGQVALSLMSLPNIDQEENKVTDGEGIQRLNKASSVFKVIKAKGNELKAHHERINEIEKLSGNNFSTGYSQS